jgi:hypothetical protein
MDVITIALGGGGAAGPAGGATGAFWGKAGGLDGDGGIGTNWGGGGGDETGTGWGSGGVWILDKAAAGGFTGLAGSGITTRVGVKTVVVREEGALGGWMIGAMTGEKLLAALLEIIKELTGVVLLSIGVLEEAGGVREELGASMMIGIEVVVVVLGSSTGEDGGSLLETRLLADEDEGVDVGVLVVVAELIGEGDGVDDGLWDDSTVEVSVLEEGSGDDVVVLVTVVEVVVDEISVVVVDVVDENKLVELPVVTTKLDEEVATKILDLENDLNDDVELEVTQTGVAEEFPPVPTHCASCTSCPQIHTL